MYNCMVYSTIVYVNVYMYTHKKVDNQASKGAFLYHKNIIHYGNYWQKNYKTWTAF